MAKKRKHLSRAHRAAIAKGLKRYYRAEKRKQAARRAAAKKAATTRALKKQSKAVSRGARKLREIERREARAVTPAAPPRVEPIEEEWEVTIRYQKQGALVSVSVVVLTPNPLPSGQAPTREEILGAVWRVANGHALTVMQVRGVDWRKETATGKVSENSGTELDLQAFKGMMFKSVLRAERVGD